MENEKQNQKVSLIEELRKENLKTDIPNFGVGDTIQVDVRIIEGGKERIQAFTGTVIGRNGGGISETVTVRRISHGQGVERILPLHSPRVAKITVVRQGLVRRAKLYYLRNAVGNAARVKEKRLH